MICEGKRSKNQKAKNKNMMLGNHREKVKTYQDHQVAQFQEYHLHEM